MQMRIDKERDIVRILIRESPIAVSDEAENGVIYDFDDAGRVVGLEFLNASEMLGDLTELEASLKRGFGARKRKAATAHVQRYEPLVA
jgi:uncharacterized protein YuzE